MIRTQRLQLSDQPQQICDESEVVNVTLNFLTLTKIVYIGDSSVDTTFGFPLKNDNFKWRQFTFTVIPGDKFCAMSADVDPPVLNILIMSAGVP